MDLVEKIFNAGIVGAGGGGFPSHIKAKSKVEFLLANGAECEPLIHKDYELMVNFPEKIIDGIEHLLKQTNAKKTFVGIKEKIKKPSTRLPTQLKILRLTLRYWEIFIRREMNTSSFMPQQID
ncbi:electron transport complex, RnfABCDGE type, C subunit [Melioribacter roseus P3M-2]|uniref:Electron transport complex, RnfABCDGE type, C subunit n=1 Tax=Melioribacter roseus (strain DSM 23840 / JCM 17771 / VKM B-2668 / P3M-2) TaxID=1191523 RepID=I7A3A6_MELRP|nr:electron transport complex, RnfABCDGE type, C subunit [Melioribacter roseus]AFN75703.1 electron transport complex, RnfABCDGE type, C subunit [Melioribacter roseus P3M-2]